MKRIFWLLAVLGVLVVAGLFAFDFDFSREPASQSKSRSFFAQTRMSLQQYIEWILKTEKHSDPETWRRIQAVKNLEKREREIFSPRWIDVTETADN